MRKKKYTFRLTGEESFDVLVTINQFADNIQKKQPEVTKRLKGLAKNISDQWRKGLER